MTIAACLIVKDEAHDIAEWIAFHATAGFDAILVYDNNSSDGTTDILHAAARLIDLRVIPWPSLSGAAQVQAYEHALRTYQTEFDWIAFIDSDEYLVVHPPYTLQGLCARTDAAAIGINWAIFGSNNHTAYPTSLITEAFTRRAIAWFDPNFHVKSIVRTRAAFACLNPHAFQVAGRTVRPDGTALAWRTTPEGLQPGVTAAVPDFSVAQINHYFTRSRAHWASKSRRSYPNPHSRAKLQLFDGYDRNEVEDRSALRRVLTVRALQRSIRVSCEAALPPGFATHPEAWPRNDSA